MQISLKLIWSINHAKSTVCIKFQLLVTFSSLFTASSNLPVFPLSVLYVLKIGPRDYYHCSQHIKRVQKLYQPPLDYEKEVFLDPVNRIVAATDYIGD